MIEATGMSSRTVHKGLKEIEVGESGGEVLGPGRVRRPGGGRKRARDKQPGLVKALERLVDPTARGDPKSPLRWTCKSTRKLADELRRQGFDVGPHTVARELKEQGFSLHPTARGVTVTRMRTGMGSSDTSTRRRNRSCVAASRSSR